LVWVKFLSQTENNLYNKRVRPTKNEPQQGISNLEREREGVREREGAGVSKHTGLKRVNLCINVYF
jgi:hypothetical protein